jgi:hypothetical protein
MKKNIILLILLTLVIIALSLLVNQKENYKGIDLPANYTLENYSVAEVLDISCDLHSDCETPVDYAIRSNCPYTALCLKNKCTVVCPSQKI